MINLKNWLVHEISGKELGVALAKYAKGSLLDVGCGDKPYEKMARSFVSSYTGLEHKDTQHNRSKIDIWADAYHIPVEDGRFDTLLCTAVLEHLEEPERAIQEAKRVLKNGSYAIYAVPMFWHLHEEPRDFYRFTKYGLRYLFEKNGFTVIEIRPLSGFWVTFGQELVYYLWRFRRGGFLNPLWWIIPPIGLFVQAAAYLLNKVDHTHEFAWAYLIVARA